MTSLFLSFVIRVFCFATSVVVVSRFLTGIQVGNFSTAVSVALVYGVFNFIAYYVFGLLTLPFGILTLGLGFWITNTILLLMTSSFVEGFQVAGWVSAMIASALISLINCILHIMTRNLFLN